MSAPLRPRHWVYLDEEKTHEVHAQIHPRGPAILLHTTEMPAGSRDPAEALVEARELPTLSLLERAMRDLEERLALSGTYYRADAADLRWSPLQAPAGARRVDLRAHEIAIPGGAAGARLALHHFHGEGGRDTLLIAVPRTDLETPRSILAQVEFDFPDVEAGEMRIVHARLAPSALRTMLVRQHIELPQQGYAKLIEPRDYERAYGAGWLERARDMLRKGTSRVFDLGRTETLFKPAAPAAEPRSAAPASPREALARALASERVASLRARYLPDADAARLLEGGEWAIRRHVTARRRIADHTMQYDLGVLESSLLIEYALQSGKQDILDEEGAKLLRYATGRM